jgi:hypothetical protein
MRKKTALYEQTEAENAKDEFYVDLTIRNIPASLLNSFAQKIVSRFYPEGVSQAIKDLMLKAMLEQQLSSS